MTVKLFDFPVYECEIKLVIGDTLKECCDEEDLPWEEGLDSNYDAYVQIYNGIIYMVLRKDNSRQIVLHECIHAINKIYDYIHADINLDNDEVYVREVSYFQEQVLKVFENEINSNKWFTWKSSSNRRKCRYNDNCRRY